MLNPKRIKFNSHTVHNPSCDIVEYKIDNDTFITYGVYVTKFKDIQPGEEFMEIYVGENYNVGSKKRSYSRMYYASEIPGTWKDTWKMIRKYYQSNLTNKNSKATLACQTL
jgi:hypothetical protein